MTSSPASRKVENSSSMAGLVPWVTMTGRVDRHAVRWARFSQMASRRGSRPRLWV
jgi:hypothetical protein